jgi:hypothetical protein
MFDFLLIMVDLSPVVKKNLYLMRSKKEGGMSEVIMNESIGGNAGASHLGINFHYHKENGKIAFFGNIQDVPTKIRKNSLYVEGSFSYYIKFGVTKKFYFQESKIDKINYNSKDTREARINLALSAKMYNELYGGYKEEKIAV